MDKSKGRLSKGYNGVRERYTRHLREVLKGFDKVEGPLDSNTLVIFFHITFIFHPYSRSDLVAKHFRWNCKEVYPSLPLVRVGL